MPSPADVPAATPRRRGRPRTRPSAGGTGDPREDIVAAAGTVFALRGVHDATMAEIAEQAGLQQSSIYYYFRSKADILASILERVNRVPLAIVARERSTRGPVAERLYRIIREDVLALCGFPFDINEIHRLAGRQPDDFEGYWAERRQLDEEVEALVAEGIRRKELRRVDARLAAVTLLANDEATQHWFRDPPAAGHERRHSPDELADHVATLALRGLLADPTTADAVRTAALAS